MKYISQMESVLIAITALLCAILVFNLLYKLRLALPWRVNCWFCNSNFWVKFIVRNSWVCPKCEQYNGFTKDGDYNKPVTSTANDSGVKSAKTSPRTPPKNGLCKMCNVNQQLKVAQLANFVPMNERNFDDEIDNYKMRLEKAYKLCSPCRKVLQKKLHKEKEALLGSKVLESRTPEKKSQKIEKQGKVFMSLVNNTSMTLAGVLLVLVSAECYKNMMNLNNLPSTIVNIKDILFGLLDRIITIVKMKLILTFPLLENYTFDLNNNKYTEFFVTKFNLQHIETLEQTNDVIQKSLGGVVCFMQIIGHFWNANKMKYTILIDLLWSVFVMASIANSLVTVDAIYTSLVKLTSILAVLLVYKIMKSRTSNIPSRLQMTTKKMKTLNNGLLTSFLDDDSDTMMETDDDVSLSKFGLHNFTDSSNETISSPLHASLINGRSFTPRKNDSILWNKPKLNSTFSVNSVISKSPSSISECVFVKPTFNKYQNLAKDDSDSDLDESISSLCISSPKKASQKSNSIFSLRKFAATPNFVAPAPMNRSRPLISPSKLGHSTSWVAGGYWGTEGERQIFSVNGSRSSSQSSGFESQASSVNRNMVSQPPSREESVCGEERASAATYLDRFSCNASNYGGYQSPQSFARVSSPVFPQMQYNGHVHIPQPRPAPQSAFTHQQYVQNGLFKPPGMTGIIKLPQMNSFSAR